MINRKLSRTTTSSLAALLIVMAAPAHATTTFPGTFCQTPFVDGHRYSDTFGVHMTLPPNSVLFSIAVWCPIRLHVDTNPVAATVTVYDRSDSRDVECTLFMHNLDGTGAVTSTVTSSGNSAAAQVLNFGTFSLARAFWSIRCLTPPPQNGAVSHVASYSISQ